MCTDDASGINHAKKRSSPRTNTRDRFEYAFQEIKDFPHCCVPPLFVKKNLFITSIIEKKKYAKNTETRHLVQSPYPCMRDR
jgi:hypothetical protein